MPTSKKPKVTIVGGGISGLTAALRLAQRGYAVTVYESTPQIGGNMASYPVGPIAYPDALGPSGYLDVYTHMFSPFYHNFWDLAEGELGLRRGMGEAFEPRSGVRILDKGKFPQFAALTNNSSFASVWNNLLSGVASPADLLLWVYSQIDSLSHRAEDDVWDKLSVEGFLTTRPWATPMVVELYNMTLITIWSIHASQTSAAAYRRFVDYSLPLPTPFTWLLTGPLQTKLMQPLEDAIKSHQGTIIKNAEVQWVHVGGESETGCWIDELAVQSMIPGTAPRVGPTPTGPVTTVKIDPREAVILAVPPKALYALISTPKPNRDLKPGEPIPGTIYGKLPGLSEVQRLEAVPLSVCYLCFKKKLPHIPKENVLLRGSSYNLSFLDLSQIWHDDPYMKYQGHDRTVLALGASDDCALPEGWDHRNFGLLMIQELHEYLGVFRPVSRWYDTNEEDPNSDIDWTSTYIDPNLRSLFTNVVGCKQWQPRTHYPDVISNLYFAGDCTVNKIRMATVESAVYSGLQAARAVWEKHKLGEPVEIKVPETYPLSVILALKTLLGPSAYAAKCWHDAAEVMPRLARGEMTEAGQAMAATMRDVCILPYAMAVDWWQAAARTVLPGHSIE